MNELTEEQRATLADLLDEREQALKSTVHDHVDRLRDTSAESLASPAGDTADQAELRLMREHETAAVSRDMRELREIEAARERLANGEAGVCVDCGEDIAFERLRVQPSAMRCVRCQTLYEHTHAQQPEAAARDT